LALADRVYALGDLDAGQTKTVTLSTAQANLAEFVRLQSQRFLTAASSAIKPSDANSPGCWT